MIFELKLEFKDTYVEPGTDDEEPFELTHTLAAPAGMEVTGGQIYVENLATANLARFSFRIDRDDDGKPSLTIMEDVA
jgi:hypothetical protein